MKNPVQSVRMVVYLMLLGLVFIPEAYTQNQPILDSRKKKMLPLSAFIAFEKTDISAKDSSARIQSTISLKGGTPLIRGQQVLFLVKYQGNTRPRIVGDFNEWVAADGPFAESGYMTRIGSTDWYTLQTKALPKARFEYLIQVRQEMRMDSLNPRKVLTFASWHSEVVLPNAKTFSLETSTLDKLQGSMDTLTFSSLYLQNTRFIYLYTPPTLQHSQTQLPTLYILDGESWLEADLANILDKLIRKGDIPPLMAVFVPPLNRAWEYGGWKKFRQMMVAEIIPRIDSIYPTDSTCRGLLGVSRGGLAVLDLAYKESSFFTFAAALAPAIHPIPFIQELEEGEVLDNPPKITVLKCLYDLGSLQAQADALEEGMRKKGYPYQYLEAPVPHSYAGWKHYVDEVLRTWQIGQ